MVAGVIAATARQIGGEDERSAKRHDIILPVHWNITRERSGLEFGVGRTINISSTGLLIATDRDIPAGINIDLTIPWPRNNSEPVELSVTGRVVRCVDRRIGVQITNHRFRNEGKPLSPRAEWPFTYDAQHSSLSREALLKSQSTLPEVKRYRQANGLIVMCMHCRRTRCSLPGQEIWEMVDRFISQPPVGASHGLCDPCLEQHYPHRP